MSPIHCLGIRHRMPVAFGPRPGPRQGPQGQRFDMSNAPRTTTSITFLTDARKLQEQLPTMLHAVNPRAALPIVRVRGASVACTRGSSDPGSTRSLH